MSEKEEQRSVYVVDTNILMDWQARYYPTDIFTSMIEKVDQLIHQERFIAPKLVQEELDAIGTDALSRWAKNRRDIWIPHNQAPLLAATVQIQGHFPGLLDPKAEYEEADAYVIGLAQIRDGIVVTSETPAAEKRNPKREFFIPDVCRELGIPCINLLGLFRRERWTF